ncbi:hypothetical protein SRB5_41780 [Streptomyces sp. RB5]|uniref:Pectate lyase n=1 Tax=Streptomyces smaragdinus TaxID=2585196 RepID=A0A7K0CKL0_9ACTN|nr:RICIN domain-containing protein [Streptomyces smaragdinus]MQY14017.1 hypothetical protein [Streptomyces smaragdinus]
MRSPSLCHAPGKNRGSSPRTRRRGSVGLAITLATALAGALVVLLGVPSANAAVGAGTYTVANGASGLCLTLPGSGTGVQLQQAACNGATTQKWTLTAAGGGFTVRSVSSGLCVGVRDASTSAGKVIEQQTCNGSATQTWTPTASGSNYRLVNGNGGKCMNTKDNSTAAGALVQTNSCDSVATKQWTLTGSDGTPPTGDPDPTEPDPDPTDPDPGTPPVPDTSLAGWATQGGGTTGGSGGPTVTVTSLAALTDAVAQDGRLTVRVNGNFSCSVGVRVSSDKTVIGVGSSSGLNGCGLGMKDVDNVVVRNMKISNVRAGNGNGDAIHIDGATHLWLDHNDLSSDLSHDLDYYDGLLDMTHGADYITVSWNVLHDHYKCSLVGHSDSNASEDRGHLRVTYHHNKFSNCYQRNPRVRFANPVHVYNNYYTMGGGPEDYSYGVATTMGAGVLVEGNYFENIAEPTHLSEGDSDGGSLVARNNTLVNSGPVLTSGSVGSIPYAFTAESSGTVKASVNAGAGTGKISG